MNCTQIRIYLSPYLDSELDPTTTFEISRHLEGCEQCARLFEAEACLERAIRDQLRQPVGDEEQVVEDVLARVLMPRHNFPSWRALTAVAAILLALAAIAYHFTIHRSDAAPQLLAMAAKDHRRHILGEVSPEVVTSDPTALASFFEGKLNGEIGSLPTGDGWEIAGGRVCNFEGVPVAFVSLRYHGIPVSVVDVPTIDVERALEHSATVPLEDRCFELQGGRGVLRRTSAGLRAVFGDLEMSTLEQVVQAAR